MSDSDAPPTIPGSPPPQRNGCLTAFLLVFGIILLLPSLCTLFFFKADLLSDPTVIKIASITFAVGFGGIALIWLAFRRPRP
jgi:hypothetical protein